MRRLGRDSAIVAARRPSGLLESQETFVDAVMAGLSDSAAAAAAGNTNGTQMANVPRIQEEIARARQQIEDTT